MFVRCSYSFCFDCFLLAAAVLFMSVETDNMISDNKKLLLSPLIHHLFGIKMIIVFIPVTPDKSLLSFQLT